MEKTRITLINNAPGKRRRGIILRSESKVLVIRVSAHVNKDWILTQLFISILHYMRAIKVVNCCPSSNLTILHFTFNLHGSFGQVRSAQKREKNIPLDIASSEFPCVNHASHCKEVES